MTKFQIARIAAATAVVALSSTGAFAADSLNMTVQATVVGTCKLVAVPLLDFGTLNQVTAPAVNPPAVNVTYHCTKGITPGFTIGGAAASPFTGSLSNGTDTIAYTIAWAAGAAGTGFGTAALSLPLTGSMAGGANYQNVSSGTYSQTVAVDIAP